MMGNVIFSRHRATDRKDIAALVGTLQREIDRRCTTGKIRRVIFDDSDVFLPYLIPIIGSNSSGSCEIARETIVTPFKEKAFDCQTVAVRELTPSMRGGAALLSMHSGYPGDWAEIGRWTSSQGYFGFALVRPTGCVEGDGT